MKRKVPEPTCACGDIIKTDYPLACSACTALLCIPCTVANETTRCINCIAITPIARSVLDLLDAAPPSPDRQIPGANPCRFSNQVCPSGYARPCRWCNVHICGRHYPLHLEECKVKRMMCPGCYRPAELHTRIVSCDMKGCRHWHCSFASPTVSNRCPTSSCKHHVEDVCSMPCLGCNLRYPKRHARPIRVSRVDKAEASVCVSCAARLTAFVDCMVLRQLPHVVIELLMCAASSQLK